jgi:S1-C subfamily serine protease
MQYLRWIAAGLVVVMSLTPSKGRAQAKTSGWVGVVITTGIGQSNSSGALVFNDYPVIESIDPGSPAEKFGLLAGDILIAINSQDLRANPIPNMGMLIPGAKVNFRYVRDNVTRTTTITVAERPAGTSGHTRYSVIGPAPERIERVEVRGERPTRTPITLRERAAAGAPFPAVTVPLVFGAGSPSIAVAGAELTQLNDGLREILKFTGDGVFVINVAVGTPAGSAGLKSGDVIIRAERETVRNPGELIRIMRNVNENALMLHVLRNQKPRTITLRW